VKKKILHPAHEVLARLAQSKRLWLFLDYDGSLADFAPTPDIVTPDPELLDLLTQLAGKPDLHVAVISGRRLRHLRRLVPLPGIWLAGTYGIELLTASGELKNQLDYDSIRPALEEIKPKWEKLIASLPGFYLEDKGWSLAIHARFASGEDTEDVLGEATQRAHRLIEEQSILRTANLRLLGGDKFLEVCPQEADKGSALQFIFEEEAFPGALPVFIGDDDKDEAAFSAVKALNGIAILVAAEPRPTQAAYYLGSPTAVRAWLVDLLQIR
jgi:trehalose 6-phosphate phosphatase